MHFRAVRKRTRNCILIFIASLYGCRTGNAAMTSDARGYIEKCADSINNIIKYPDSPLPYFLSNACLDYEKQYWRNIHNPLQIRKEIIDRVKNAKAIEYVLNYGDQRIAEKCERQSNFGGGLVYYKIEMLNKSFADLLQERLTQIRK
ncbi:hypothetical protein DVR12_10795 [Chitinophaga silvatica]|uniref:Uncharacterized protein n=1 Tax=Chitinophaga silvatica TaxID=2282649 RepID=A0A3E1YBR2_9BACT|nr:hypothetical protein [Chitinophaga silvatica]RFS23492.1 hypothetical protein DVR12_10795 [Chitinophaga silvatica]